MTREPEEDLASTWPFWAPSEEAAVDEALDLAELRAGDTFVDLGCGDGQVLRAAAARGAVVRGIEYDAELAQDARRNLAAAGVDATVVTGDLFDPALDLSADVVFTYLAPATLQRLTPRLRTLDARLITVDYAAVDLEPDKTHGSARRYDLPGRPRVDDEIGWPADAHLVTAVPDHLSLTCLELVHPAGPTKVRLAGGIRRAASVFSGADGLDTAGPLAVDLRWEPDEEGAIVTGTIQTAGLSPQRIVAIHTDDDHGIWDLGAESVDQVLAALRRRHPPTTLEHLLDEANR